MTVAVKNVKKHNHKTNSLTLTLTLLLTINPQSTKLQNEKELN